MTLVRQCTGACTWIQKGRRVSPKGSYFSKGCPALQRSKIGLKRYSNLAAKGRRSWNKKNLINYPKRSFAGKWGSLDAIGPPLTPCTRPCCCDQGNHR